MNAEKMEKHLIALKEKHKALETRIEEENARPAPNDAIIQELKKQKLKIKEEIYEIESKK